MTTAPEAPAPTTAPNVYQAIALVMRDTSPVGKDQINQGQRYKFRGIDDLMSAVAGPMRTHGVFLVPEVVDRTAEQRGKMLNVVLTMRYRIFGPAGDCIEATVSGEASDTADKATNKAMSAALKYLLLQVLMVPIDARSIDDGDRHHPENEAPQQRQAEQQPRRSNRAEPGPWENEAPPQQPQPSGPSRDFIAEAQAADDVAKVRELHAQAKNEGAPPDYLAQIVEIGSAKPGAKPRQQQGNADRSAAVDEMYRAARDAGLSPAEADDAFAAAHGCMPADATAEQLRAQAADLRNAVGGAQ